MGKTAGGLTEDRRARERPRQISVNLELPEVVHGEVPEHVGRNRGMRSIHDHAPVDEKPGVDGT